MLPLPTITGRWLIAVLGLSELYIVPIPGFFSLNAGCEGAVAGLTA